MSARPLPSFVVLGAVIAGGLAVGTGIGAAIAAMFVMVVEATGLAHHFGHHGIILTLLLTLPVVVCAIGAPILWRSLERGGWLTGSPHASLVKHGDTPRHDT